MINKETRYYEIHTLTGLTFLFKLDLNPLNNEYEPHIWHRHQIEPEQVVCAFLNESSKHWNIKHHRYEAYSETDDLIFWYFYADKEKTKIYIITALRS
jgi:hypothetical protein